MALVLAGCHDSRIAADDPPRKRVRILLQEDRNSEPQDLGWLWRDQAPTFLSAWLAVMCEAAFRPAA